MQFINCNFSTMYIYLYIIHTYIHISMYMYNFALFWLTGLFCLIYWLWFVLSIMFMLVCKPFLSIDKLLFLREFSCALIRSPFVCKMHAVLSLRFNNQLPRALVQLLRFALRLFYKTLPFQVKKCQNEEAEGERIKESSETKELP